MLTTILLLIFCTITTSKTESFYCDFEESCEDFIFDSYWIVNNVSSHKDHTYGNLSGHYITYINNSMSQSSTTFRARDWMDLPSDSVACLSQWIYSGPGGMRVDLELAQGDDLQARLPVGGFGMNMNDPQWRGASLQLPDATHYILYALLSNITGALDLDDISLALCHSSEPIPPAKKLLDCDFDRTLCPELISLSNYSYTWSTVQAEEAQNYTSQAPATDHSVGDKTGHYIWLNNLNSLQSGGAGYLSTQVFHLQSSDPAFCLSFQYYRFGLAFQTSKLTVLALDESSKKSVAQIWPINPVNYTYIDKRWSWAYASLPIGNYSLLFRMDSDYEVNSSFALDSISIKTCSYPKPYFYGTSSLDFACDFDSPMDHSCGIRDDYAELPPLSVIGYTISSPKTINNGGLGPKQTTGWSGEWFLYWSRSESTSPNSINGQFKIPSIETNRDMCIRFAYFVNSTDVQPNEDNTKIHVLTRGCHNITLWSIELDNSFGWQLVTQTLRNTACTESIYFRITQQRPTPVAVAFDDITIAQCGTLDVLTTTVAPSTTTLFNKSSSNYINSIYLITVLFFVFKIRFSYK